MSHFSKVKTSLKSSEILQGALTDIGIEWFLELSYRKTSPGEHNFNKIVIYQKNNHHITFEWNGISYELVADLNFWQQPLSVNAFLERVTQKYAYKTIITQSSKNGFNMIEESNDTDGSIHLVMNRWYA